MHQWFPQTVFDMIDKTLRDIFESRVPFAGKYFILEWDFWQEQSYDKIGLIVIDDDSHGLAILSYRGYCFALNPDRESKYKANIIALNKLKIL